MEDELFALEVPEFQVDDVEFMQPFGFIWFQKPRYRVKAVSRKLTNRTS